MPITIGLTKLVALIELSQKNLCNQAVRNYSYDRARIKQNCTAVLTAETLTA